MAAAVAGGRLRFWVPAGLMRFAVAAGLMLRGYIEADEIMHFMIARQVWENWRVLLSIWGRMACTALYAPVAPLGFVYARLVAVGVTARVDAVGMGYEPLALWYPAGRVRLWVKQ